MVFPFSPVDTGLAVADAFGSDHFRCFIHTVVFFCKMTFH
jgi:hypothetical protein